MLHQAQVEVENIQLIQEELTEQLGQLLFIATNKFFKLTEN
jgi:hypothetical protein